VPLISCFIVVVNVENNPSFACRLLKRSIVTSVLLSLRHYFGVTGNALTEAGSSVLTKPFGNFL